MLVFKCRDASLNVFEIEAEDVPDAIEKIEAYEQTHETQIQCYEKGTGKRIIGGELQVLTKDKPIIGLPIMKLKQRQKKYEES